MQLQLIQTLPTFDLDEHIELIRVFFEDHTFSHIAIVDQGRFVGVIAENDMECFDQKARVAEVRASLQTFFVSPQANWLDVLEQFARNEANLLPVIDTEGRVMGYYDLNEVVSEFIHSPFFTEPGGIVVVAVGIKDYSFSEIAQIVESNNTRILGAFVSDSENDVVQVTLKLGQGNLNDVLQTFRRYNYTVVFGNEDDQYMSELQRRNDYLDRYLNIGE